MPNQHERKMYDLGEYKFLLLRFDLSDCLERFTARVDKTGKFDLTFDRINVSHLRVVRRLLRSHIRYCEIILSPLYVNIFENVQQTQ